MRLHPSCPFTRTEAISCCRPSKRREAERRKARPTIAVSPRPRATAEPLARIACFGRARLSALHRGACPANQCRGSVQAVFPGTCGGRRYLPLRCPSPAGHPADRSLCRPKRCPDRPGAGLRALAAGTAPTPSIGRHRLTSLRRVGCDKYNRFDDSCQYCLRIGDQLERVVKAP
jgi:hypothetical protein